MGGAIVAAPVLQAAVEQGISASNLADMTTWRGFIVRLVRNFTGYNPDSGAFDGAALVRTYGPLVAYAIVKKTGISKPVSRVLGRFGLRF